MSSANHKTGKCSSDGINIFYRQFGSVGNTPILIVHGLSYFSYDWIDVADSLADDREVVAIDMRGFGESDWSAERDYSIASNAHDFVSVLDHLGWSNAVLIGHSLGGRFCTFCAAEYAGRVNALVAVDFAPAQAPEGSARVAEIVGRTPDLFASIEEAMDYYEIDPHTSESLKQRERFEAYLRPIEGGFMVKRDPVFRDNFRKILETGKRPKPPVDMWDVLGRVRCPILVLRGTHSDMLSAEIGQQVKLARPDIEMVEIDAGHNIAGENPNVLISEIRSFLRNHNL